MTENPCRSVNCPAACCRNIIGQVPGRKEFFLKAFPRAEEVSSQVELEEKIKSQEKGVYLFEEHGWTYFAVSGSCPNLDSDLNCSIHEEPFYPKACKNMAFKSIKCEDSKMIYQLNMISFAET